MSRDRLKVSGPGGAFVTSDFPPYVCLPAKQSGHFILRQGATKALPELTVARKALIIYTGACTQRGTIHGLALKLVRLSTCNLLDCYSNVSVILQASFDISPQKAVLEELAPG